MWIICENGDSVNLARASGLEWGESEAVQSGLPRPFVVIARFIHALSFTVICTRDTKAECLEAIQEITSDMCGWIDPTQKKRGISK